MASANFTMSFPVPVTFTCSSLQPMSVGVSPAVLKDGSATKEPFHETSIVLTGSGSPAQVGSPAMNQDKV